MDRNRVMVVASALLLLVASSAAARRKATYTGVLPSPADAVLDAVHEIAKDGIIRGTSQFAGEKALSGAVPAESSQLFGEPPEGATVIYKVRPHTLAPTTFEASNDVGTVAVRYLIEPVDANKTRLTVDAVFVEDSRHGDHPSEGAVELSEYNAIAGKLKAIERARKAAQLEQRHNDLVRRRDELQHTLRTEQERSETLAFQVQQLRQQRDELQRQFVGEIIRSEAQVRSAPHTHAAAVLTLKQGDKVEILSRTAYWLRVRTSQGKEGWIYRLALEGVQ